MSKAGERWVSKCGRMELCHGHYMSVLDHASWDATITDPPYGERTHQGHNEATEQVVSVTGQQTRRELAYDHFTPEDVHACSDWAHRRSRGWFAAMTSHDLIMPYEEAADQNDRYPFAPVLIVQKRPRLLGDGPANWLVYLCTSRPRTREFMRWRCLPGLYFSHCEKGAPVVGAKPLALMRAVVRDYTQPGDTICDPCAGWGTTLLAAAMEGRRAIGAEIDRATFEAAVERLSKPYTADLWSATEMVGEQAELVL